MSWMLNCRSCRCKRIFFQYKLGPYVFHIGAMENRKQNGAYMPWKIENNKGCVWLDFGRPWHDGVAWPTLQQTLMMLTYWLIFHKPYNLLEEHWPSLLIRVWNHMRCRNVEAGNLNHIYRQRLATFSRILIYIHVHVLELAS